MTSARAEEVVEFTVLAAEAAGCVVALEAAHAPDPAPDIPIVLLDAVVQAGAGAVPDGPARHAADRPG